MNILSCFFIILHYFVSLCLYSGNLSIPIIITLQMNNNIVNVIMQNIFLFKISPNHLIGRIARYERSVGSNPSSGLYA